MLNRTQLIKLSLLATLVLNMGSAFADGYGYGGDSYSYSTPAPKIVKTALTADSPTPAAIKISGANLTDKNGMTLYTFDKDAIGSHTSACNGDCAVHWPALTAADTAKDIGDFSIVVRNDGRKQWAVQGKPLYMWVGDTKAGDAAGDGFGGVWHKAVR